MLYCCLRRSVRLLLRLSFSVLLIFPNTVLQTSRSFPVDYYFSVHQRPPSQCTGSHQSHTKCFPVSIFHFTRSSAGGDRSTTRKIQYRDQTKGKYHVLDGIMVALDSTSLCTTTKMLARITWNDPVRNRSGEVLWRPVAMVRVQH